MIKLLEKQHKPALETFLSQYAETSMFMRSNLLRSGIVFQGEDFQGDYYGAFDADERLLGVLAQYWNGIIMIQAPDTQILQHLAHHFMQVVTRPVMGVIGEDTQAQLVIHALGLDEMAFNKNKKELLYSLSLGALQRPDSLKSETYRMVSANDIDADLLFEWIKDYEHEALGAKDSDKFRQHIQARVKQMQAADCWILLVDNQPVSLSGFNARLPDMVQIGPVWTPVALRCRGYARALVALTLEHAYSAGVTQSILFTDNPAAAKSYIAIGFKEIGTFRLALLSAPTDVSV